MRKQEGIRAFLRRILLADGHCPSVGIGPLESRAGPLKPLAWQVRSCSILPWLKHFDALRRVFPAAHLAGSCCVCVCRAVCAPELDTQLCSASARCRAGAQLAEPSCPGPAPALGCAGGAHRVAVPLAGVTGTAGSGPCGWVAAGASASPAAALKPHQRNR